VRAAAAAAAKCGLEAILQLEERVPGMGPEYYRSGNVFLGDLLGAEHMHFGEGENETGADDALRARADQLRSEGRTPFVIPLGLDNKPLGALGYVNAAAEILDQDAAFDAVVVASGSGATHGGLLAGLRANGSQMPVFGICVRRDAQQQSDRMKVLMGKIAALLQSDRPVAESEIKVWDGALAPGYGQVGQRTVEAMRMMARYEGLFEYSPYKRPFPKSIRYPQVTRQPSNGRRLTVQRDAGLNSAAPAGGSTPAGAVFPYF
jgi:1-aminocyclopropane-1-carboxylate deaminase/D-cysteine desulfhydrase-like pyridoxal-dependent ACC family enzyme